MGTSLNELKTGREKLAIINEVLSRITAVSTALDNTRIEEIVGLKEQINGFYNQTLEFKNLVIKNSELTQNNKDFVENKAIEIKSLKNIINENLKDVENFYNNILEAKEQIQSGVDIVKEKYPQLDEFNKNFLIIKMRLKEYYKIAVDFNLGLENAQENQKLTKSYLDLCIDLKEQILKELEHAKDIKEDMHANISLVNKLSSNIIATKNEIISISNSFKNVKSQVQDIVNSAEETIKLKVNTILFENQRLNQNMIDLLKRCEKLEAEIVGKYENILEVLSLIEKANTILMQLREAVEASKEFANELNSYTQMIKDFKIQMDNLKLDLQSYNDRLKGELELKANEINLHIDTSLSNMELLKEQMQGFYEQAKNTTDTALKNFIERATIANENIGKLTEVARTELANDKTAIETYLIELQNNIIVKMKEVSSAITDETSGILAQKNQIEFIIANARSELDNLKHQFNANYESKIKEFNLSAVNNLRAINIQGEENIQRIEEKTQECINTLNNTSEEKSAKFDQIIKDNLSGIYSHIFSIENVLLDKKIIKLTYKE